MGLVGISSMSAQFIAVRHLRGADVAQGGRAGRAGRSDLAATRAAGRRRNLRGNSHHEPRATATGHHRRPAMKEASHAVGASAESDRNPRHADLSRDRRIPRIPRLPADAVRGGLHGRRPTDPPVHHGPQLRGDVHLHQRHRRLRRGRGDVRHVAAVADVPQHLRGDFPRLRAARRTHPADRPPPRRSYLPRAARSAVPEQGDPGRRRADHLPVHPALRRGRAHRRLCLHRDHLLPRHGTRLPDRAVRVQHPHRRLRRHGRAQGRDVHRRPPGLDHVPRHARVACLDLRHGRRGGDRPREAR